MKLCRLHKCLLSGRKVKVVFEGEEFLKFIVEVVKFDRMACLLEFLLTMSQTEELFHAA